MQMDRTRVRRDRFDLRGWTYPFHELRDGATFARLEANTDDTQEWTLRSGQVVEVRPGDIALIAPQIGMPVPGKRRAEAVEPPPAALPPPPMPAPVIEEEPLPDTLARLVPQTLADREHREWLRRRWQELTHRLVDGGRSLPQLGDAERMEHQQLERYRGLFS
jgi:hypothetical protein